MKVSDSGQSAGGVSEPPDEASDRSEARLLRWDAALLRSAAKVARAEAGRERASAARERARAALLKSHRLLTKGGELPGLDADGRFHIADRSEAQEDERERLADEREADADERERLADERDADADERERLANEREADTGERAAHLGESETAFSRSRDDTERSEHERKTRLDDRERKLRQAKAELDERERVADQRELSREVHRSAGVLSGASTDESKVGSLMARGARLRALAANLAERLATEADQFADHMQNASTRGDRDRRLAIAESEREIARIERENAVRLRDFDKTFNVVEHLPRLSDTTSAPETRPSGDTPDSAD